MKTVNLLWRSELRSGSFAESRRRICELRRSIRVRPSLIEPRMSLATSMLKIEHTVRYLTQVLLLKYLEAQLCLAKRWVEIRGH
jgi:hypothetical protein